MLEIEAGSGYMKTMHTNSCMQAVRSMLSGPLQLKLGPRLCWGSVASEASNAAVWAGWHRQPLLHDVKR